MTSVWRARIEVLLGAHPRLLATSVHNKLRAEGFGGSYPTVVRAVRDIRGPRFRAAAAASVPTFTGPGEEVQFDFCNLDAVAADWGWDRPLRCFGAILCWSRRRMWWFTASEDQNHTFEGLVRALECFGGVPAAARTDRMGALGASEGRRCHPARFRCSQYGPRRVAVARAAASAGGAAQRCLGAQRPGRAVPQQRRTSRCEASAARGRFVGEGHPGTGPLRHPATPLQRRLHGPDRMGATPPNRTPTRTRGTNDVSGQRRRLRHTRNPEVSETAALDKRCPGGQRGQIASGAHTEAQAQACARNNDTGQPGQQPTKSR